jgi:hypothetical protein
VLTAPNAGDAAAHAPIARTPHPRTRAAATGVDTDGACARAALEAARLTVTGMAEELGIPRATLEAYRLGTRRAPAAARARLAAYLARRADVLRQLAAALAGDADGSAQARPGQPGGTGPSPSVSS